MKNEIVRYTWIVIGLIFFAIGTVGVFLPLLPTFPFYVVTLFCFGRSSKKLHDWFVGTNLYKNNLEKITNRKGLTVKHKLKIIVFFTLTMGTGFYFMKNTKIGRIILAIVWFCHVIYFAFGIKTIKSNENEIENIKADMDELNQKTRTVK